MRRIIQSTFAVAVALVVIIALHGTARAAQAFGSDQVVGHAEIAIDSNAHIADPDYTATHENVVILQAWETSELRALRRANPNVKVLMYQNASSASTSASGSGLYPTGVSYTQAVAHHWLLRNTHGQTFTFGGENWLYATDIGSRGYAEAWAHNVVSELKSAPWSGVFIDDVNPTIGYHYTPSQVAKYPNDARYGAAMGRFVRVVGHRIMGAHELAVANIGSWSSYPSVVDPWLHSLSGAMDEEFVKWGTEQGTGYADEATWHQQMDEVELTQREHKLFLGVSHSSAHDTQAAVYGYATELLAGHGNAIFSMSANYSQATWFPEYNYTIGTPTGRVVVDGHGVYARAFSHGRVVVNPTTATATVALGGTYSGSGRSHVRRVTLAPHSAAVLVRS